MSRLTGNDAMGLMEAYASVYEPQELTEEQIQEDFESWVNDLLEEGYDLSDYTWNEMYEEYLSEIPINPAAFGASKNRSQAAAVRSNLQRGRSIGVSGPQGFFGGRDRAGTANLNRAASQSQGRTVLNFKQNVVKGGGVKGTDAAAYVPKTTVAGGEKLYLAKLGGKNVYVGARKPGSPPVARTGTGNRPPVTGTGTGNRPPVTGAGAGAGGGRPAPVPASPRPAATTSRPPVSSAKSTPAPTPSTTSAPQKSTFNPLMQRTFGYQTGNAPDQRAKAPEVAQTSKIAASPRPLPVQPLGGARQRVLNQSYEYMEPFDLVLEYLVSEGHADTLDEALYLMMEMDSETIQGICEMYDLEELYKGKHGQSETEYMDSRSPGGKMISGDSTHSGASWSHRSFRGVGGPVGPGERQPHQGRMDTATRMDILFRKNKKKKNK